jgi:hypothetical protein
MQPITHFSGFCPSYSSMHVHVRDSWLIPYGGWDNVTVDGVGFTCAPECLPLKSFRFFSSKDAEVYLRVVLSKRSQYSEVFEKYLVSYGFVCRPYGVTNGEYFESTTHEELKALFQIVSLHCDIPSAALAKIRKIVEQGYWYRESTSRF